MNPVDTGPLEADSHYNPGPGQFPAAPAAVVTSPPQPAFFRYNSVAFAVTAAATALVLIVGAAGLLLLHSRAATQANQQPSASSYGVTNLPLQNVKTSPELPLGEASLLDVNGQLRANDTLVLTPGKTPSAPVTGQFYYDQNTNQPYYYNGANFVALGNASSLQGPQGPQGLQGPSGAAACAYGTCLSLQTATPGVQEAGNIDISGTVVAGGLDIGTANSHYAVNVQGDINTSGVYRVNGQQLDSADLADAANIALLGRNNQTFSGNNKFTGSLVAQDAVDSTAAFQVQSAGGSTLLNADTTNNTLTVSGANGGYSVLNAVANTGDSPYYMAISGNYAYVTVDNSDQALEVYDITNPYNITQVDSVPIDEGPGNIVINGDYAYITTDDGSLQVFNISNPSNVTQVGGDIDAVDGCPGAMDTSGDYLFVVDYCDGSIQAFNISNPADLTPASDPVSTDMTYGASSITVEGSYIYVAGEDDNGDGLLESFDISNPADITQVGSLDIDSGVNDPWLEDITAQNGYLYGADVASGGLYVFNIANPSDLTQSATDYNSDYYGVAIAGNYAYAAGDNLYALDISNLADITQTGEIDNPDISNIAVSGSYAYVITYDDTLQAYDISDPSNPTVPPPKYVYNPVALQVNGGADFQNTADTNSAFRIQNAAGDTVFNVDTLNSQIALNADTTIAGSSATAFQVQDSDGNDVVNVDTTNHALTVSAAPYNSLGPNLITDDDFSDANWTTTDTSNWTLGPNSASYAGTYDNLDSDQFTPIAGDEYAYGFTLSGGATSNDCVAVAIGDGYSSNVYCGDGTYTGFDQAADSSLAVDIDAYNTINSNFTGTISNVTVQQIEYGRPSLVVEAGQSIQNIIVSSDELSPSNDFTNAVNWTATPSDDWSLTTSSASWTNAYSGDDPELIDNQVNLTAETNYQVSFTLSSYTIGCGTMWLTTANFIGGVGFAEQQVCDGTNVFTVDTDNASGPIIFLDWPADSGTISNISIKQVATASYVPAALSVQDNTGATTLEVRAPDDNDIFIGTQSGVNYEPAVNLYSYNGDNTAVGDYALGSLTAGVDNTVLGNTALYENTTGSENVALGSLALQSNVTGSENVALGEESLQSNVTGSNNVALGWLADVGSSDLQNATAVGSNSLVSESNALALGCVSGANSCTQTTLVGVGTTAPQNLFSVGDLYNPASTYQVAVSTGGATNSGLVVQTVPGQSSGYILQAQDYSGAVLASIDYKGNLSVKAATVSGTLTIEGHVVTGNTSGNTTAAVQTDAGSGGNPACSVSGNDTAGLITLTTGTSGWAAGAQCAVSFSSNFASAPHPVITPTGSTNTASVMPTVTATTGGFTINFLTADSAQHTYTWDYFNAQ